MLRAPQRAVRGAVSRQVMDSFHSDPVLKREGECGVALQADPAPNLPTRPISHWAHTAGACALIKPCGATLWACTALHSVNFYFLLRPELGFTSSGKQAAHYPPLQPYHGCNTNTWFCNSLRK